MIGARTRLGRGAGVVLMAALAWAMAGVGCGDSSGDGGGGAAAGASGGGAGASCSGNLTGPISGAFTCLALAVYYPNGSSLVEGRMNSLVTIISNPADTTHVRPDGVDVIAMNIEVPGELPVGTYSSDSLALSGTLGSVIYADESGLDSLLDKTAVELSIDSARKIDEDDSIELTYLYEVSGSLTMTLSNGTDTGTVTATF